jgi:hypothetical protein
MREFLKKIGRDIKEGFKAGVEENFPPETVIEPALTELLGEISDENISDEDIWERFLLYCRDYDPELINHNTIPIIKRMMEIRPSLHERIKKKRRVRKESPESP